MRARTLTTLLAPALACFNPTGASTSDLPDPGSSGDAPASSTGATVSTATTAITTGPDASTGTTVTSVCGDGVVDGPEQCDDAAGDSFDNCEDCRFVASLLVFASPDTYQTTQVSPPTADMFCNQLGKMAKPGGQFFAWVGAADFDPREQINTFPADLPYVRGDGVVVALDSADLLDGNLLAPIDRGHGGAPLPIEPEDGPCEHPGNYAWTGANFDGYSMAPDCDGWTSTSSEKKALVGNVTATSTEWSQGSCTFSCDQELHIYCIEKQP